MAAALTLRPALLSKVGGRMKPATQGADTESGFSARWSGFAARRLAPVAIIVLVVLAWPATHMRLATSDDSTYKKHDTSRVAHDLLKQGFGAGLNGPLPLAVELPKAGDTAALEQISRALGAQDGSAAVLATRRR